MEAGSAATCKMLSAEIADALKTNETAVPAALPGCSSRRWRPAGAGDAATWNADSWTLSTPTMGVSSVWTARVNCALLKADGSTPGNTAEPSSVYSTGKENTCSESAHPSRSPQLEAASDP